MREGWSPSATGEALQFPVPVSFCDEMVMEGDDCPSWRESLVESKVWLDKSTVLK